MPASVLGYSALSHRRSTLCGVAKQIVPGDVPGLAPAQLREAGEYTALAALARAGDAAARAALVASARTESAFRWIWALGTQVSAEIFNHFGNLAGPVAVPRDLDDAVTSFVLKPLSPPYRQGLAVPPAVAAQNHLLQHLDSASPLARAIAISAVRTEAPLPPMVRQVALDILGTSTEPEARNLVVRHAVGFPPHKQSAELLRLAPPYSDEEYEVVALAVEQLTRHNADDGDFQRSAELAVRLRDDILSGLLVKPWHSDNKRKFVVAGLLPRLGADRIMSLLCDNLGDTATPLILERVAVDLRDEDVIRIGRQAHAMFPPEWTHGIREKFAQQLVRRRESTAATAIDALWQFVAATDNLEPAATLAPFLMPGELRSLARGAVTEEQIRRLGHLARYMQMRDGGEQFAEEVTNVAVTFRGAESGAFTAGLTSTEALRRDLPDRFFEHILHNAAAIAAHTRTVGAGDLVHRVTTPEQARDLLLYASRLESNEIAAIQDVLGWPSKPDRAAVIKVLREYPLELYRWFGRAVESLSGPEADAAPTEFVINLGETCLQSGLTDDLEDWTDSLIERLLELSPALVDIGCRWIRQLELSEAAIPDAGRVQAVVEADNERDGQISVLAELRAGLGLRLAEVARAMTEEIPNRVSCLRLAAAANPAAARAAALDLADHLVPAVREESVRVLAETHASSDDHDRIVELIDQEQNSAIRRDLKVALTRVRSGDIGQALENLVQLLGLSRNGLDPAVLFPSGKRQSAFIQLADQVRTRITGEPGPFFEAAINLAQVMVDLTLLAATDAGESPVKPEEAERIRSNAPGRLDEGDILRRQQLLTKYLWFSSVAALREGRSAHFARLGETESVEVTDEDVIMAKGLLKRIVDGWLTDMHGIAARQKPLSS